MANPVRSPDPRDPLNPVPPMDVDPLNPGLRTSAADPVFDRPAARSSNSGTGILIAAVIAVLAVIAYFMFAGNGTAPTTTASPPAVSDQTTPPATGTAPADSSTKPAAPAGNDAMAPKPAAPAAGSDAMAPKAAAPAEPAPAKPAPAPAAPAQ